MDKTKIKKEMNGTKKGTKYKIQFSFGDKQFAQ